MLCHFHTALDVLTGNEKEMLQKHENECIEERSTDSLWNKSKNCTLPFLYTYAILQGISEKRVFSK